MNNPINHHFVPKVYLKEFANSQKQLYQVKKEYDKISIKTISQICYKPNYFKFNSSDNLYLQKFKDLNYIEKNVFTKQENQYSRLLKKFTVPVLPFLVTNRSDAFHFIETLITIKRRNPFYREQIIEDFKKRITSDQFRKQAEKVFEISRKVDRIDPEVFFEKYVENAINNKETQADIYLQTLVDEENNTSEKTAELLLRYKLKIYYSPPGSEFITSDNPGFTILPDGRLLLFGGFALDFTFVFPLTPKYCLYITHTQHDVYHLNLHKEITFTQASKEFVDTVNEATYQLATEKVFGYTENILLDIKERARNNERKI